MILRPPRSTRTDTLFPYTTLFRSAALTYDDPMPEEPFDKNGNGLDDDGRSLELPKLVQVVPIRNGQDALIPTPGYLGRWARLIQKQYREEELLQFEGRLRPVARERSEERRVGKGCVSKWRSRWSQYH